MNGYFKILRDIVKLLKKYSKYYVSSSNTKLLGAINNVSIFNLISINILLGNQPYRSLKISKKSTFKTNFFSDICDPIDISRLRLFMVHS